MTSRKKSAKSARKNLRQAIEKNTDMLTPEELKLLRQKKVDALKVLEEHFGNLNLQQK